MPNNNSKVVDIDSPVQKDEVIELVKKLSEESDPVS